jgi:hypothetical protein
MTPYLIGTDPANIAKAVRYGAVFVGAHLCGAQDGFTAAAPQAAFASSAGSGTGRFCPTGESLSFLRSCLSGAVRSALESV